MKKKSLMKNSMYNILYQGFSVFFPLFAATYISRILEPEGVGKIAYATVLVNYFIVLASLGLPNYGIRAIAQNNDSIENRSKTFFELITLNFVATTVSAVLYFGIVNLIPYFSEKKLLLNIIGIELILNYFNIDWFYKGIEEYRLITTRAIIVKLFSFALILLFVRNKTDYYIYAMILALGYAGNYIYNIIIAHRYLNIKKYKLDLIKHLRPVFILFAATVASQVYSMLDTLMLEFFYKDAYVGYYSNSVKIVRMIHTFVIAVVTPFYPRISMYLKNKDYNEASKLISGGIELILLIGLPSSIGVAIISNDLVTLLFGSLFSQSIKCLIILSPLIFILSIAYFAGHVVLMSVGREKYILYATVFSSFENLLLNMILIPKFQHNGAAIASLLAELTVTFFVIIKAKKYYSLKIDVKDLKSVLISICFMTFIALICINILRPGAIRLLIVVAVSVITYFLILILSNNKMIKETIIGLLKRFKSVS